MPVQIVEVGLFLDQFVNDEESDQGGAQCPAGIVNLENFSGSEGKKSAEDGSRVGD
jgi:hypothetical protein